MERGDRDRAEADARLFASDALAAARRRMSRNRDGDVDSAVMAVFALLALAALFPELVREDRSC